MPEPGDVLLAKRRTVFSTEQDDPMYGTDTREEPKDLIKAGWKLKHFVSYKLETATIREYYFVWPDLFKDAVAAGLSRGEDNVVS
jgi:hypothetical protein